MVARFNMPGDHGGECARRHQSVFSHLLDHVVFLGSHIASMQRRRDLDQYVGSSAQGEQHR